MEKHIIDERTGIPYTLVGDYYLPWGGMPDDESEHRPIGLWGQRHLRYIKQHRWVFYTELLNSGKLNDYLADLNDKAEEMFSRLVEQTAVSEGISEQLKAANQTEWVGQMNSVRAMVQEIVYAELIFI